MYPFAFAAHLPTSTAPPTPLQTVSLLIKRSSQIRFSSTTGVKRREMSGTAGDIVNRVHDQVHTSKSETGFSLYSNRWLTRSKVNPFKARDEYPRGSVITHRVCSVLSYILVVITSIFYTFERPHEGEHSRHTIWDQNRHRHSSFALNSAIVTIYWSVPSLHPLPAASPVPR